MMQQGAPLQSAKCLRSMHALCGSCTVRLEPDSDKLREDLLALRTKAVLGDFATDGARIRIGH